MSSIINLNQYDSRKEPLFFSDKGGLSIQRYDRPKYEFFMGRFQDQLSYYWRPEEVNLTKDKSDFNSLTDNEKFIFIKNLSYQILLDSVQSRGIDYLLKDCSNPEIEAFCKTWSFFETLHSYSYTYIIKQITSSPDKIFDYILDDEEVRKRTLSVTKYYDNLIFGVEEQIKNEESESVKLHLKKKALYLTLISINILEGIRFYVSFVCTYAFAQYQKKMEGNAKIISLINRDENLHLAFGSRLLKIFNTVKEEGFMEVAEECKDIVKQMYLDAAKEEMEWAEYLFKNGTMVGLNAEILIDYMKWLTNNRLNLCGFQPVFEKIDKPFHWIDNWTGSQNIQEAPQETEKETYVIGAFKQDINELNFNQFEI